MKVIGLVIVLFLNGLGPIAWALKPDFEKNIKEGYVENKGVKLHYVEMGSGSELIVLLHGFPDYWYTFRDLMEELSVKYKVVALDLRGYNLSDKPKGVENYKIDVVVTDVEALIKKMGAKKAIIIGHDWGGRIAWALGASRPDLVEKLVILSSPHPLCLVQQLKKNKTQKKAREYIHKYYEKDAYKKLNIDNLISWVKDPEVKKKYLEAIKRSSLESMMNYYQANRLTDPKIKADLQKKITVPVLEFVGGKDDKFLTATLTNTWNFATGDLTLVVVPEADHYILQSASQKVIEQIKNWLK